MRPVRYLTVVLVAALTFGCVGMNRQQQSTLSGGAIGAAGGAFLGAVSGGSPAVGAVVGGAAGALTGFILGDPRNDRHYYRRR
ncbi:YMGG-like glycine zipper-containing protein [Geomonas sp. Red32]|uniref:YMGG-like glycine zipper-containing protein n=1 Tax=Geomonas sp. Red32 TaxID=2912856 RepID=UPI00202CD4B5|nr:YMGG-like glycine zipper-containing protein [Geomonas sp. Red32]MCM0082945.1 YMGG-like glycine zipper-containing protein [Geomonas sp. Red32]